MWSDREIQILTAHYPKKGSAGTCAQLDAEGFKRSSRSIESKAMRLGIERNRGMKLGKVFRDGHGYFRINTENGRILYHNWLYENIHGPIPEGMVLMADMRLNRFRTKTALRKAFESGRIKLVRRGDVLNRYRDLQGFSEKKKEAWMQVHQEKAEELKSLLNQIKEIRKEKRMLKAMVDSANKWKHEETKQLEEARERLPIVNNDLQKLIFDYQMLMPTRSKCEIFKQLPKVA
jgi:hypothetical protein